MVGKSDTCRASAWPSHREGFVPIQESQNRKPPGALFFLNRKLQGKHSSHAVVKRPKVGAGQIVLHIARIEVISDVEDLETTANPVLLLFVRQRERLGYLQIERGESWITFTVPWPHKVSVLVNDRIRKTFAQVQYRRNVHTPLRPEISPEQKTVGRVVCQPRAQPFE